ncbi:MAG: peptidyl-tRNA hydrolase Pth2 [Candidatus Ranarchaeia archaeon]
MVEPRSSFSRLTKKEFNYKQVIVVRQELKMTKGKMAVQVAHGAVTAAERAREERPKWFEEWMAEGQKKIVAKVASLRELFNLRDLARSHNLPYAVIQDAGLTELPPGTITVLAIGPAPTNSVDNVTINLKLL